MDVHALIEDLIAAEAELMPGTDEMMPRTGLEVEDHDVWQPATESVWRAWTGRRAVWGIEYHGPVYAIGASEDAGPWTGSRVCACKDGLSTARQA